MRKKVLISSILTIALCISLIAGSTFALFTSTSQVNVAVTSGKVSVVATASGLELGSTLGENLPETLAAADGNTITLDKMVPGDFITFTITIHNDSDVTVKYRTLFAMTSGDESFFNALKITVDQQVAEEVSPLSLDDAAPAVATPAGTMLPGCEDIVLNVKVELPESAGNEHQEKSCAFAYTVEAVQGNGEFETEYEKLSAAIQAGQEYTLGNDITLAYGDRTPPFSISNGVAATVNLNGHSIIADDGDTEYSGYANGHMFRAENENSQITINGDGTVQAAFGLIQAAWGSKIVINGGDFIKTHYTGSGEAVVYVRNGATVEINGGSFKCTNAPSNTLNVTSGGSLVIKGGSFYKCDPTTYVASGYKVVQDGDWYNVVPE